MISPESLDVLRRQVDEMVEQDRRVLDQLRAEVQPLRRSVKRIKPHRTTAISLVGTDGGNNQVVFDPFLIQVVRVVDSSNNEYCLEAITPRTPFAVLDQRHLANRRGVTPLGRLMNELGIETLHDLSPVFTRPPREPAPSWIQVYREMTEWAILFEILRHRDFATDTIIIQDGLLRSKMFSGYHFRDLAQKMGAAIAEQYRRSRRRVYVAGIAKHSKVLQTYQLAMALEGVMRTSYPAYVEVPRELEESVYRWDEYARGAGNVGAGGEGNRFVAGKMFLVKFGSRPHDPVWAIDLLEPQASEASTILGFMLSDAVEGFPVPFYPHCLQRAHENAALVDFDTEILSDQIRKSIRAALRDKSVVVDEMSLQLSDVAARRYSS